MNQTLRIIHTTIEFKNLEGKWNSLLKESSADNYFLTWDWLWTWWQIYATKEDKLTICIQENEDGIVGVAPCYVRTKRLFGLLPVKSLMFLGTQDSGDGDVCSDYMDLIYRNGEEIDFVKNFLDSIVQHNVCDELCFKRMDISSPSYRLLQQESIKHGFLTLLDDIFESPFVKLPATWDDYLNSLSSAMRYKIRRERRKLEKCENVTITKPTTELNVIQQFEELVTLHQKRWNSRDIIGSFANQQFSLFHRKIIPLTFKNKQLSLTILAENGVTKAAFYNVLYKNRIYFYQSGVETGRGLPAYGYLLHSYCIEESIKNGLDEYDFLPKGGNDGYKDHFANDHRKISSIYIVCRGWLKIVVKLKEWLRRIYRHLKKKPLMVSVSDEEKKELL